MDEGAWLAERFEEHQGHLRAIAYPMLGSLSEADDAVQIAPIVGRSEAASRQLASRARRRVRGASAVSDIDLARRREVVEAFHGRRPGREFRRAARGPEPGRGAPCARRHAGRHGLPGGPGARAVAGLAVGYSRLGLVVHRALVNGTPGLVSTLDGRAFAVGGFTVAHGKIVEIDILADPERLAQLDLAILKDGPSDN